MKSTAINYKTISLLTYFILSLWVITSQAENNMTHSMNVTQATFIPFNANNTQDTNLSDFLKVGANLVAKTEPLTYYWYALKNDNGSFGIIDFFPNEQGRAEHFAGQVAGALKANSDRLVANGWDEGILSNVNNFKVLSHKLPESSSKATLATLITLKAQKGKEKALENLLTSGAQVITNTEPKTLLWTALKLDDNNYAIFDTFTDASGRQAHFSGQVAAALNAQAENIVQGGWEKGVLSNVHHFSVIADSQH